MVGSHIDTVINAGQYDGCLGVIGGIEVIKTLKDAGYQSERPIVVGAFTNGGCALLTGYDGTPGLYAVGLPVDEVLKTVGTDGTILGES